MFFRLTTPGVRNIYTETLVMVLNITVWDYIDKKTFPDNSQKVSVPNVSQVNNTGRAFNVMWKLV